MTTTQIFCPNCHTVLLLPGANAVMDTPLICPKCGQDVLPRFVCPDENSPARHEFAAHALYLDNDGAIYTFCPEHTFTTYALSNERRPTPLQVAARSFLHFWDSLAFRLALTVAGWRWRALSRR